MNLADRDGFIWHDGKLVDWREAKVHVLTHAMHYGTAVFEGVRAYRTSTGTAIFRLAEHTRRLLDSAKILGLPVSYGYDELMAAQIEVVAANRLESAYIRPLLYFGSESLGIDTRDNQGHAVIAAWEWGTYLGDDGIAKGIRVRTSSYPRHHPAVTMCRGKIAGHYVNSIMAHCEAKADGFDEALQLDTEGFVSEGSGENLFLIRDGCLITPQLGTPLAGITRQTVIDFASDEGIEVHQGRITRDDVYIADEAFFTGTAAEVTPIREVDRRMIGDGTPGEITQRIQKRFFACVKGEDDKYAHWLTPVEIS